MIGRRIQCDGDGPIEPQQFGDFWRYGDTWYAHTPNGLIANLGNHEITEHEDKTITVAPSILVTQGGKSWHGYLERGAWREV